ncbi:helix-turn-helix domain-containing protein [Leisingera sp. ANG-M7]|uniref:helix-turn-helix domain-containing protein n=1 Tax=Leisingera sp. ANG-M7 TaxID=1577902 RepID=UPI00126991DD
MEPARPFSADTLAERWGCSAESVRQLARQGAIRYFRVGKMYRFPKSAVEEFECQTSGSDASAAASASTGTTRTPASESGISLTHAPERKRKPRQ